MTRFVRFHRFLRIGQHQKKNFLESKNECFSINTFHCPHMLIHILDMMNSQKHDLLKSEISNLKSFLISYDFFRLEMLFKDNESVKWRQPRMSSSFLSNDKQHQLVIDNIFFFSFERAITRT